jgi:lauroyl/myristoyl acyltransferase
MQLKDVPLTVIRERADLLRGLMLVLIFRPAAFVCPDPVIWGLAYACATIVVLQASGRRMAQDYRTAFGMPRRAALRMAIRAHASRFHEFAFQQKIILGWLDPFKPPVKIEASDEAQAILDGPGSFMVALAHFERTHAAAAVFHPTVFANRPVYAVAFKLPSLVFLPHVWRMSLQLRQLLRATRRARPQGLEFVYLGGATARLIDTLRTGRAMATVNIDAHWPRGRSSSLTRPFAGATQRTFSTGSAKLARLAGTPLLLAIPVMSDDRSAVRMRLFGPFHSNAVSADQQDVEITQQMLDAIEREVGKRPCEYVLDIGGDRRWDPDTGSWRALPVSATAESLTANPG